MYIDLSDATLIKLYILFYAVCGIVLSFLSISLIGILLILPIIYSYISVTYLKETRWINEGKKLDDFMLYCGLYGILGIIAFGIVILISIIGISII